MPRFSYTHAGITYSVDLEPLPDGGWRATIDGRMYHVELLPQADGGLRLRLDDVVYRAHVAAQADRRHIWVNGTHHDLEIAQAGTHTRRKSAGAIQSGRLTAQMPGQVRLVLVSEGDAVARGQTLLVLEAMKMELRLTAPADGTVRRIHVEPGNVVERDALLIELDS